MNIKFFLKKKLKKYLRKRGYRLAYIDTTRPYIDIEDEISIVKNNTMLNENRLISLYDQVKYCEENNIEGSFVECGIWKGGGVGIMALANLKFGRNRRNIHMFDAFDDICEPDPDYDGERALSEIEMHSNTNRKKIKGRLLPVKGFYNHLGGHGTIEDVRSLLESKINYPASFLHFYKGWFEVTVPQSQHLIDNITILRLDGDWYSSTKVCINSLYDKVVKNGFIIIDDYGAYDGCRKAIDEFLLKRSLNVYLHKIDEECVYLIK